MMQIDQTMLIGDILELDTGVNKILLKHGLTCEGCPGSYHESLAEAAEGHGVSLEHLLRDLNQHLKECQ